MRYFAAAFSFLAVVAAVFAFSGIAADMARTSKILFVAFVAMFLLTGLLSFLRPPQQT
jgi:uncharacterized membrane protein YtjA (UPF0391 family)